MEEALLVVFVHALVVRAGRRPWAVGGVPPVDYPTLVVRTHAPLELLADPAAHLVLYVCCCGGSAPDVAVVLSRLAEGRMHVGYVIPRAVRPSLWARLLDPSSKGGGHHGCSCAARRSVLRHCHACALGGVSRGVLHCMSIPLAAADDANVLYFAAAVGSC